MKNIIKKLFDKGFIDKESSIEEDFDLLPFVLKKREIEQKKKLNRSKSKGSEIDAFLEILEDSQDLFSESELYYLYNNIFEVENKVVD